jgi:LacI family transcriptional regulator
VSVGQKQSDLRARVIDYLRGAGFVPGAQLPNERELAGRFGVGRTALRPVLQSLQRAGILERRPQSGTFLKAVPAPPAPQAKIVLIAPFGSTGERARENDALWLHRVASAFERVVVPAGAQLIMRDQAPRHDDPCSIKIMAHEAVDEGAQAVVLLHPLGTREKIGCALSLLHDRDVHPLIVSSRTYPGLASQVYFDSGWGAYLATRQLLQAGHQRIGFAGAPGGHQWVQERIRAYEHALEVAEIKRVAAWIWTPENSERLAQLDDGEAALKYFWSLPAKKRPTALVAANDVVALGVLEAARQQNIEIPRDLSLVGFDNDAGALVAGLTTVERPTEALGEAVARVMLERLNAGPHAATVTHRLRPVLIERATVAAPHNNAPHSKENTIQTATALKE